MAPQSPDSLTPAQNETPADRLNAFADFLETVPPETFDMRSWVNVSDEHIDRFGLVDYARNTVDRDRLNVAGAREAFDVLAVMPCGTTACMAGFVLVWRRPEAYAIFQKRWGEYEHYRSNGKPTERPTVSQIAKEVLGLNNVDAVDLFHDFVRMTVAGDNGYADASKDIQRAATRCRRMAECYAET